MAIFIDNSNNSYNCSNVLRTLLLCLFASILRFFGYRLRFFRWFRSSESLARLQVIPGRVKRSRAVTELDLGWDQGSFDGILTMD